tara:strand:- start:1398 stop:2231 length:834 start_codon:yes stop_codon:yes gene_type:complete
MTTLKASSKNLPFNASRLTLVMQAGLQNARKGALQNGLSLAASTLIKGEQLTTLEMAQLLADWKGDKAPSRKTGDDNEKRLGELVKKYMQDSRLVASAAEHISEPIKAMFTNLYTFEDAETFAIEAEKVIKNIKFLEALAIESKTDLNCFWSGFLPEAVDVDVDVDVEKETAPTEAINATGDVDLETETATKKPSVNQDEINNRQALANDALALLADEMPFLDALLATAQKQDTQEGVILTICQGFKAELDKVNAEKLALENKLHNLTPKAKAKKAA